MAADVAVLEALTRRLSVQEASRRAGHVAYLQTMLQMHAVYCAAGMEISTVANAALVLGAGAGEGWTRSYRLSRCGYQMPRTGSTPKSALPMRA